ncbi:MAG: hypothetical protein JW993_18175 [Sedimentisphaerales bacterium]|nr:hypothetical protein [Sedimentisphaerales bacterium]
MKRTVNSELPKEQAIGRRDFIQQVVGMLAAAEVSLGRMEPANANQAANAAGQSGNHPNTPFVGIQMSPHTMLDEGIEPCLDLIKETAAVNAVFVYSHAFHTSTLGKPLRDLATDHGKPPRDFRNRVPSIWVRHHDEYFRNTRLRVRSTDSELEFADRDLFTEIVEPCRARKMKVYARILEAAGRHIENFDEVRTIDVYGNRGRYACWSHPDYRNFWSAVASDMFGHYDLDGFQWGAERMGPLMNVILPWNDDPPTCFCEHCIARGQAANIDAGRAKEGYTKLFEYVRRLADEREVPAEGVFTIFLRHLIRYPEILSWEYQYRLSREAVHKAMYDAIKAVKPAADVGWHVDHQPSSWDIVYRAEMSYEEMAPYSDFIKLILYHAVLGGRIYSWYLRRFQNTILRELSLRQSLEIYYDLMGYDKNVEPSVEDLRREGFSPDYVYRETKRSVASANGKTKIYAGIGIDVPGSPPEDPEKVYQATLNAFRAGVTGIVVSREYEEMKVPNLCAIGRGVREAAKTSE